MATEPRLLLVDELAAGLNPAELSRMADRLRALADGGMALLVVRAPDGVHRQGDRPGRGDGGRARSSSAAPWPTPPRIPKSSGCSSVEAIMGRRLHWLSYAKVPFVAPEVRSNTDCHRLKTQISTERNSAVRSTQSETISTKSLYFIPENLCSTLASRNPKPRRAPPDDHPSHACLRASRLDTPRPGPLGRRPRRQTEGERRPARGQRRRQDPRC